MGINLLSPQWWISTFIQTFVTIIFIWMLKKAFTKVNVPVVSEIVAEA